jgi:hypothetical protein
LNLSTIPTYIPLSSFTNLSVFEVNLDTMVPSYISDDSVLLFLASFFGTGWSC